MPYRAEHIDGIEAERLALQNRLDAEKSAAQRNRLGQFATPTRLARDMLAYGRELLGKRQRIRFLDPAIGTGSFYSALRAVAPQSKIARSQGFDIDPHYAAPAARLWRDSALELRVEDFTRARPPLDNEGGANLLICNPPYVRHHHLDAAHKRFLRARVRERLGMQPSGLAGLYCYFLWLAHAWLAPGGVAGWLIPGEWMDVNYGAQVKEYLLDRVRLLRVHRFDPDDVQFDDALVSSVIVWFKSERPALTDRIQFSSGGRLCEPTRVVNVSRSVLRAARKWSRLPGTQKRLTRRPDLRLADLFTTRRGVATGANRFFVLGDADLVENRLPRQLFRPILPGPRYLDVDEIRSLQDGDPDVARKLYLLDTALPEQEIRDRYPALWRYLQRGVAAGISERYLCRHRTPWYAQEQRPPPPLLCTYMGRRKHAADRPFRFILNHSRATASNVYLLLYPRPTLARALADDAGLMAAIWRALNRLPVDLFLGEGRVYGGGLHKLEPRELANLPLSRLRIDLPNSVMDAG